MIILADVFQCQTVNDPHIALTAYANAVIKETLPFFPVLRAKDIIEVTCRAVPQQPFNYQTRLAAAIVALGYRLLTLRDDKVQGSFEYILCPLATSVDAPILSQIQLVTLEILQFLHDTCCVSQEKAYERLLQCCRSINRYKTFLLIPIITVLPITLANKAILS